MIVEQQPIKLNFSRPVFTVSCPDPKLWSGLNLWRAPLACSVQLYHLDLDIHNFTATVLHNTVPLFSLVGAVSLRRQKLTICLTWTTTTLLFICLVGCGVRNTEASSQHLSSKLLKERFALKNPFLSSRTSYCCILGECLLTIWKKSKPILSLLILHWKDVNMKQHKI